MEKIAVVDVAQLVASLAAGVSGWILGGLDQLLSILVVVTVLDVISGLCQAFHNQTVNSSIGYRGITRKVGIFVLVAAMHMIDLYMGIDFLRETVIAFFIFNEILSIMENCGKMGLPMPEKLKNALAQLQTDSMNKKQAK